MQDRREGQKMERLKNKVIVVAGAGGIGAGLAVRFAQEGASVVLGDINADAAQSVVERIRANGGTAVATSLDGAEDSSCKELIGLAVSQFGGLDGIHVNFAELGDGSRAVDILDLDMADFDEAMRVNTRGYVLCTRHAIPALLERGGGAIVYTSSNAAYVGEPVRVAYAMSKGAILPLMRHVASRFGSEGIRANAIAPGVIMHPRLESAMPEAAMAAFLQQTVLKRLGTPEHIAALAALLMADEGNFITGQVLSVDGGDFQRP
ncbi:SDR family NAD(P)-dependent oxidoreductase [Novosphingobium album (ex Hu et al. 2023)]|uniref:SDR family oxidoreductase n=1 Tax=Novosphingobium album (ex Hu et al. 2023) TaxID=2930093 RepID=A0ABT0B7K8_9SPHN|nr:SDR family oxidoreductase [Novosphingobium album (ex Hu et al. 2023)]MCJ2180870.1 SDR family oxidoreductase [Novosphingobium album (ex Hu et al. 2023)]